MLQKIFLIGHVFIAVSLILIVLLQRGKGAEAGAAFGAGASGTVFGARGSANFLSRTTKVLAVLFFASSVSLAYLGSKNVTPTNILEQALQDEQIESQAGEELLPAPGAEQDTLPELPDLVIPEPEPVEEPEAETE